MHHFYACNDLRLAGHVYNVRESIGKIEQKLPTIAANVDFIEVVRLGRAPAPEWMSHKDLVGSIGRVH